MDNQGGRLLIGLPSLDHQPELCFYLSWNYYSIFIIYFIASSNAYQKKMNVASQESLLSFINKRQSFR